MPIKLNTTTKGKLFRGSQEIAKVYLGSQLKFSSGGGGGPQPGEGLLSGYTSDRSFTKSLTSDYSPAMAYPFTFETYFTPLAANAVIDIFHFYSNAGNHLQKYSLTYSKATDRFTVYMEEYDGDYWSSATSIVLNTVVGTTYQVIMSVKLLGPIGGNGARINIHLGNTLVHSRHHTMAYAYAPTSNKVDVGIAYSGSGNSFVYQGQNPVNARLDLDLHMYDNLYLGSDSSNIFGVYDEGSTGD